MVRKETVMVEEVTPPYGEGDDSPPLPMEEATAPDPNQVPVTEPSSEPPMPAPTDPSVEAPVDESDVAPDAEEPGDSLLDPELHGLETPADEELVPDNPDLDGGQE